MKIKNKVLIDFFPPFGKPEITLVGSVALYGGILIAVGITAKILVFWIIRLKEEK